MAAIGVASSSPSMSPARTKEKPVVVRVKRKSSQAKIDVFWLEINERPLKRPLLDLENLSISGDGSKDLLKAKRLLVQHVETVRPSEAIKDVLESFLPISSNSKDFERKIEERKNYFKQDKKQDQLRSIARHEHEELGRSIRFKQIWKSRKGEADSLRELCQFYDVVRVDAEDEKLRKKKELEHTSLEDNAILCNYLPLLRECIPSAAAEIESEMKGYASREEIGSVSMADVPKEDGYVYDLYTVEDKFSGDEEKCDYPLVQVEDGDDFDDMPESEYDSEDSNAEDNPRNDYPDEESSNKEDEDVDPFGDFECPNSDSENEIVCNNTKDNEASKEEDEEMHIFSNSECSDSEYEDEVVEVSGKEDWRWGYR